jgi:hypothetical protein
MRPACSVSPTRRSQGKLTCRALHAGRPSRGRGREGVGSSRRLGVGRGAG